MSGGRITLTQLDKDIAGKIDEYMDEISYTDGSISLEQCDGIPQTKDTLCGGMLNEGQV